MGDELGDLKLAYKALNSLMKVALKIGLDKTCCGNCEYMWSPTCTGQDYMTAGVVCKEHSFDGIAYATRLKMLKDE